MDWTSLIGALAFFTFVAAVAFAFVNKQRVEKRFTADDAPKSTLARNVPSDTTPADV